MTTEQFEELRTIFWRAGDEAKNDAGLADWLINFGGSMIALGVNLTSEGED